MFNGAQPTRGTDQSVGYDLKSNIQITLEPFTPTKIPTGLRINMPRGYWAQICERSSLALKGIKIGGGVIDADFTGEVHVILMSVQKHVVQRGDKIAQLVFHEMHVFEEGNGLERGEGGFGSTGK